MAAHHRNRRFRWKRLAAWLFALALVAVTMAWALSRPPRPDAFYEPPRDLAAVPGVLLRSEAFARDVPSGVRAWRILHTTTRRDGVAAVASAIVLAPAHPSPGPRPVVAWMHGTTGVAEGCAPSLLEHPFANVPALHEALAAGWVVVATDYIGLGTEGPHPYLIGEGQARSGLDAVRAARQLGGLALDARTVVWGHSQGGNAALWTGILAPRYAPEVDVLGVAAAAPASDLPALVRQLQSTTVGRIMSSFILRAYSSEYADVAFDGYSSMPRRLLARDMASRCLAGRQALFSVVEAIAANDSIFSTDPGSGALGRRLDENTPHQPIAAALSIAQGSADELVLPGIQTRFVQQRCHAGQSLEYVLYGGRDHLSLVAADSPYVPDLMRWTKDRFAGKPARAGCGTAGR